MAFHAALANPDCTAMVATINSPLTGVNRVFPTPQGSPIGFEDLAFLDLCRQVPTSGQCDAWQYYASQGDDIEAKRNMEFWSKSLLQWRIPVVNFWTENDPFLPNGEHAYLQNSTKSLDGRNIQRSWTIPSGVVTFDSGRPRSPHGLILDYHPFISEFARVVGRP